MTYSTDPVLSLSARYYTDPAIYRRELDGLLSSTWQYAGHISQLQNTGDYFCFEVAEQNLFCVRDESNAIRSFYNVCQHRAHELLEGSGNARALSCPYHSWTYALSGQLKSAPNMRAVPGFDAGKICLSEVRTEEFCGFVFVNLNPTAEPMDTWFPNVREELSAFVPGIEELKPLLHVEALERCNWKVSVENYSECYHCQKCHPTFSTGVVKPSTYDIRPQGYCLRHTTECQNLEKMTYEIDPEANTHAGDYSSWFLWPMFSFQVYPGNVLNTYIWRTAGVDRVRAIRGWYTPGGEDSAVIRDLAQQDRETTVQEDIELVESVQRGLKSRGYRPGPLVVDPAGGVNSEHSIKALQQWMREAVDP